MYIGAQPRVTYSPHAPKFLPASDFVKDIQDVLYLLDPNPTVRIVNELDQISELVEHVLKTRGRLSYVTGGFQGSMAQIQLMNLLSLNQLPLLLGLENNAYISAKGSVVRNTLTERTGLWRRLAPDNSVLFHVPEGLRGDQYDLLAQDLGVFKREFVFHIGTWSDRSDIRAARIRRAYSAEYYLDISIGNNLHSSDYI